MMDLPPEQKDKIVARLFLSLLEKYKAQRPATLRPSSVESQGQSGKATIVFGYSHNGDRHRTGYITLRWRFTRFRSLLKELYFEDKTS